MAIKIITGLGNPGSEYVRTPHNVGFRVVDQLAESLSAGWRQENKFSAILAKVKVQGVDLFLLKPQTFMNLSGEAVSKVMRYYGAEPKDLTVISDDADLPIGRLRVRAEGGAGGHRGLISIIDCCGSKAFARVRLGIGHEAHGGSLASHVLGRLEPEEEAKLQRVEAVAAKAALCVVTRGVNEAMNKFNPLDAVVATEEQRQG